MTTTVPTPTPRQIHPHKFTMWVAMGSILMMFAALTSAYIVNKNQSSWLEFDLPKIFNYSTVVMLSSVTVYLSVKADSKPVKWASTGRLLRLPPYGVSFIVMQWTGFKDLEAQDIALTGSKSNSCASFLLVITGIHGTRSGGVIASLIIFIRAYAVKIRNYSSFPIELASAYWHFVDVYGFIYSSFITDRQLVKKSWALTQLLTGKPIFLSRNFRLQICQQQQR